MIVFNLREKRIIQIHNTYHEIQRKGRIRVRDARAGTQRIYLYELPAEWALVPGRNRLWLQTVSHKGLRLLGPALHAGALAANLALAARPPYRWLLVAQALFYAAALGGFARRNARRRAPLLSVPYVVCVLNAATIVGFLRFVSGRQRATWEGASPSAWASMARGDTPGPAADGGGAQAVLDTILVPTPVEGAPCPGETSEASRTIPHR